MIIGLDKVVIISVSAYLTIGHFDDWFYLSDSVAVAVLEACRDQDEEEENETMTSA